MSLSGCAAPPQPPPPAHSPARVLPPPRGWAMPGATWPRRSPAESPPTLSSALGLSPRVPCGAVSCRPRLPGAGQEPGPLPTSCPERPRCGVQAPGAQVPSPPGTRAASIQAADTLGGSGTWVRHQPQAGGHVTTSPTVPKLVACGCSCPRSPTHGHGRRGEHWFQREPGGRGADILAPFMGMRAAGSGGAEATCPGQGMPGCPGFLSIPVPGGPEPRARGRGCRPA